MPVITRQLGRWFRRVGWSAVTYAGLRAMRTARWHTVQIPTACSRARIRCAQLRTVAKTSGRYETEESPIADAWGDGRTELPGHLAQSPKRLVLWNGAHSFAQSPKRLVAMKPRRAAIADAWGDGRTERQTAGNFRPRS